jgi:circadian clock protein KaiC
METTNEEISSLIDTWISVRDLEFQGERNRCLHIVKSRGMSHSNQIREFLLTSKGIEMLDVYLGPDGMLTGTARAMREAQEKVQAARFELDQKRNQQELSLHRVAVESEMARLRAELDQLKREEDNVHSEARIRTDEADAGRIAMARLRQADT